MNLEQNFGIWEFLRFIFTFSHVWTRRLEECFFGRVKRVWSSQFISFSSQPKRKPKGSLCIFINSFARHCGLTSHFSPTHMRLFPWLNHYDTRKVVQNKYFFINTPAFKPKFIFPLIRFFNEVIALRKFKISGNFWKHRISKKYKFWGEIKGL